MLQRCYERCYRKNAIGKMIEGEDYEEKDVLDYGGDTSMVYFAIQAPRCVKYHFNIS